jgi:hypothetical protein
MRPRFDNHDAATAVEQSSADAQGSEKETGKSRPHVDDPEIARIQAGQFRRSHADKPQSQESGKRQRGRGPPLPPLGYSIPQFCEALGVSIPTYYKWKRAGIGPREAVLFGRRIISLDEARRWLAERTAASSS